MTTELAIEKCTAEAIGIRISATDPSGQQEAAKLIAALDDYLSIFAKPANNKCLKCGTHLSGVLGALTGGFRWGLATGEGTCGCGWPGRGMHYPKDADGKEIFEGPLELILQYHPDGVTEHQAE